MAWIIMEMSENNKLLANCYRANDNICFYYIQEERADSKKTPIGDFQQLNCIYYAS